MQINIKNANILKEANILLNGLTVIAGENDTGKSTIGKLLFSLIKAVNYYKDVIGSKSERGESQLEAILHNIMRFFNVKNPIELDIKLVLDFELESDFFNKSNAFRFSIRGGYYDTMDDEKRASLDRRINYLKDILIDAKTNDRQKKNLRKELLTEIDNLKKFLLTENNQRKEIEEALRRILISEFYGELSPKNKTVDTQITLLQDDGEKLLDMRWTANRLDKLFMYSNELPFNDVTLIESPIVLQLFEMIDHADTLFNLLGITDKSQRISRLSRPKVALHIKDLVDKLKNTPYFSRFQKTKNSDIANDLTEMIGGKMEFSPEKQDFVYKKQTATGNEFDIRALNTASGIKAVGMLQMLLTGKMLDERSLLIIDEPETHLHSKWQVEYARFLVALLREYQTSILVSSHSPIFIQALNVFSEDMPKRVRFYLSEKGEDGMATTNDETKDLNKLFGTLSEPLHDLIWTR